MEWLILLGYGILLWVLSPWSQDRDMFYDGTSKSGQQAGFLILTGSVFVSWIFAKSITNAANLGASFGLVGGFAYAAWYLSIPVAGVLIYLIRSEYDVSCLSDFLISKYGRLAALAFLLAIFTRLFNEIWSNTMVVGTYFGAKGSFAYYMACFLFTAITLAYSLRGGLRSSLITDAIQVVLMVFFITLVTAFIVPKQGGTLLSAGEFTMMGGLDLLLVGLLQSLSYPFHDPVLTDRGFISDKSTMLKSFLVAGVVAAVCIVVFSLVGVYAHVQGITIQDDAPPQVASSLGVTVLLMMNIIMLTSAGSTIDSTFSSLAREVSVDFANLSQWFPSRNVSVGRWVMGAMAVLGNLPLFSGAKILQATTVSGTMVMGLAPIFLFYWWDRSGPAAFHFAFWTGMTIGLYDVFGTVPETVAVGSGNYGKLLGLNLYGLILCFGMYAVGAWLPLFYPLEQTAGAES